MINLRFLGRWSGAVSALTAAILFSAPLFTQVQSQLMEKDSFNPDEYPLRKISGLIANNPCSGTEAYDVKDIPFSSELVYNAELRNTSTEENELIKRWTVMVSSSDQSGQFSQELSVQDGDEQRWVIVPQSIVGFLKQDLKPGDKAMFYMSFVGCAVEKPYFAIEEYSTPNYEDLEEGANSYVA